MHFHVLVLLIYLFDFVYCATNARVCVRLRGGGLGNLISFKCTDLGLIPKKNYFFTPSLSQCALCRADEVGRYGKPSLTSSANFYLCLAFGQKVDVLSFETLFEC